MDKNQLITKLTYILAGIYPTKEDSYRVVDGIGIPKYFISFKDKALNNWHGILTEAKKRNKFIQLIQFALSEYPDHPTLLVLKKYGNINIVEGPKLGEDIEWINDDETKEKITGETSTLLPINFLQLGIKRATSVCRVTTNDGYGSGFLINNDIVITNNHVIPNKSVAKHSKIQFNFQEDINGLILELEEFPLNPDKGFITSVENDWTAVKVMGNANSKWGFIPLNKIEITQYERVNIIQHPSGGPKQLGIYHNIITYSNDMIIQYLTDTLPGSSGSPVFNSNWELVAIHHSGGWLREPNTKELKFRNEGININCVLLELTEFMNQLS